MDDTEGGNVLWGGLPVFGLEFDVRTEMWRHKASHASHPTILWLIATPLTSGWLTVPF